MKPKLIILNGPLGIGKSTLARRFANEHPLTLCLDIDDIRTCIGHWREEKEQSAISSKLMALAMTKIHLSLGHSVVIPQIVRKTEFFEQFEQAANDCGADFIEVLLLIDKDGAVHRFKERNYAQGHASGFRPGLINSGGREVLLATMYDEMVQTANQRPNTIKIEPEFGEEDETYQELLQKIATEEKI